MKIEISPKALIVSAIIVLIAVMFSSCRTVTVAQAANGRARCGMWLK